MPSATALKAILGASLGLGAVDLVVIDSVLAPAVLEARPAASVVVAPERIEMPVTPPPPPAPAMIVEDQRVYFATRSAVLDDRVRAALDQLAARGGRFVLEGHADFRGGEHENDKLSEQRAQAVADYLVARGVERTHIDARHAGESAQVAPGALWRDRRVDIQITREASP